MAKKLDKLTKKEETALANFVAKLPIVQTKTRRPVIVAMIGLVGSGKSTVAKAIANNIGATIIEGDAIRIELRKQGEKYDNARTIAEIASTQIIKSGGNVVLDSDFIDAKKRASLKAKAKREKISLKFVRVICDLDIAIGRSMSANYKNSSNDFFGGANTVWIGGEESRGAVVKIREMIRRLSQHYSWKNAGGGKWILKKLPIQPLITIDTSSDNWKSNFGSITKNF